MDGRLANRAARKLPGWLVGRDREGRYLEREFTFGSLGEAVLLLRHLHWLQWTTDNSSRLEWKLDLDGRVSIQLRDEETEEVTIDDGLTALVVSRAIDSRRRKRSRFRRVLRRLGRVLGGGPALLGREALLEGLAARSEWIALWRGERCVGLQSAYLFGGRNEALDFACAVLANLGHMWRDLLCDVGVSEGVVTLILHGDPRAWPPAEVFTAAEALAKLATAIGGQVQSPAEWAEALNKATAGDLYLATGAPGQASPATAEGDRP